MSDAMRSRNHKRASLRSFIFKNRYVLGWELPEFFLSLIEKEFESKNATEPNTTEVAPFVTIPFRHLHISGIVLSATLPDIGQNIGIWPAVQL